MRHLPKGLMIVLSCIIIVALCLAAYNIKETIRINHIVQAHRADYKTNTAAIHTTGNPVIAVQQIMIGTLCNNYDNALWTLQAIKHAGYDAIELNDFMIQKTSLLVRLMTKFSGMPIGKSGNHDWKKLITESELKVISLHSNLTSIEADSKAIADKAKDFGTDTVVITGMYRFDYSTLEEVKALTNRLNQAGKALAEQGIRLLYHNHNVELQKVIADKTAYDIIIEETDPKYVNFELDSYWITDGGASAVRIMEKLGRRMKLWHINDRGCRQHGPYMTPILTEDAVELGCGNMDLDTLLEIALNNGTEGIIVEAHKNWIDNDPIKSFQVSAEYLQKRFRSSLLH